VGFEVTVGIRESNCMGEDYFVDSCMMKYHMEMSCMNEDDMEKNLKIEADYRFHYRADYMVGV
jgi:hypothetical protein